MTTREKAEQIFKAGIEAVQPHKIIPQWVQKEEGFLIVKDQKIDLRAIENIYLIAAGKAAAAMAQALEDVLGDALTSGLVVVKYDHGLPLKKSRLLEAAHPVPDQNSVLAADEILTFAKAAKKNDLVFFLLSGGASSLLADCPEGINLDRIQELFSELLYCGASIKEVNTVRKQLSSIKGGGLAKAIYPARLLSLIISDVPDDDLRDIGSGPTVQSQSTDEDAKAILNKYKLLSAFGDLFRTSAKAGSQTDNVFFEKTTNYIIASNRMAVNAAAKKAEALGYTTIINQNIMEGLAEEVGREIIDSAKKLNGRYPNPACLIYGGETTVKVRNKDGVGGRSQQLALAASLRMSKGDPLTLLAGGTDGGDGPTPVAGALVDQETLKVVDQNNIDSQSFLLENDSYNFFKKVGGHITTGPTYTNVMDLVIVLVDAT